MADTNVIVRIKKDADVQAAADLLVKNGFVVKTVIPRFRIVTGSIDESLIETCSKLDNIEEIRTEKSFHPT